MKTIRFICHDGQPNMPPLITIFATNDDAEAEDVINTFGKALREFVPGSEDCPPMRYAADIVCQEHRAKVELFEADQEFGVPAQNCDVCPECGVPLSEDHDRTAPFPHNTSFADETEACWVCHVDMLERGELTQCESCHECFTYNHLIPNKDEPGKAKEICPYCGEIWCD